jgi:hypothetical protein
MALKRDLLEPTLPSRCTYIPFHRRRFSARPQSGHTKLRNRTQAGMRAISATVTMRAIDVSDMRYSPMPRVGGQSRIYWTIVCRHLHSFHQTKKGAVSGYGPLLRNCRYCTDIYIRVKLRRNVSSTYKKRAPPIPIRGAMGLFCSRLMRTNAVNLALRRQYRPDRRTHSAKGQACRCVAS